MRKITVYGICGFIGSGKSTVGDMLVNNYGFTSISFADSLKDAVSDIFGWERPLLEGDTKESREFRELIDPWWTEKLGYEVTPRKMLQKMGTEAGRNVFGDNIWVESTFQRMYDGRNDKFVITDCRFRNEIKSIQELPNGKVFAVFRKETPEWYECALRTRSGIANKHDRMESLYPDIHVSEWDWVASHLKGGIIENYGDLKDLEKEVRTKIIGEKIETI